MSALYIDRKGHELRIREGVIELRADGERVRAVPAGLVEQIVVRAETQFSSVTLAALADAGIGLIVFGGRGGQRVGQLVGTPHGSVHARVAQCLRMGDVEFCVRWCRRIVKHKVASQARLLAFALRVRPDLRKPLFDGQQTLSGLLVRCAKVDSVDGLRGIEGAAAAAYFRAFQTLFADSLGFTARRRRPPPDPVNACLSLGYTLLHARAVRAAWIAGLDPMIGFLHRPVHGRESLACDLVEVWRTAIDRWTWQAFRTGCLRGDHFGQDGAGACLMGKAARAYLYQSLEPVLRQCERALVRQARLAARELRDATPWQEEEQETDEQ